MTNKPRGRKTPRKRTPALSSVIFVTDFTYCVYIVQNKDKDNEIKFL